PGTSRRASRSSSPELTAGRPATSSPGFVLARCPIALYNRPVPPELKHLLDDLNPPQREAVTAGDGPMLVLAGAGSGKTRVIAYRIAWLLGVRGVPPKHVLAVTFTNKAAGEMARRVEELLLPAGIGAPVIATFHAACVRILRAHIRHIGYPPP